MILFHCLKKWFYIRNWILIFKQTCQFIHEYHLNEDFPISINFSRVTIHHKDFYQHFHQIIEDYQIPGSIEIEITESAFNDLSSSIMTMLTQLRSEGFMGFQWMILEQVILL